MHLIAFSLIIFAFVIKIQPLSKISVNNKLKRTKNFSRQLINFTAEANKNFNLLSIESSASKQTETDLVKLLIEVANENKDICGANNDNVLFTDNLNQFLKSFGVPNSNLTTIRYDIAPIYDEEVNMDEIGSKGKITIGYKARNQLQIILGNEGKGNFSQILNSIADAENTHLISVSYGSSDNLVEQVNKELLVIVAQDAIADANVLAESLGVAIKGISKIIIKNVNQKFSNDNNKKDSSFRLSEFNDISSLTIVLSIDFTIEKSQK